MTAPTNTQFHFKNRRNSFLNKAHSHEWQACGPQTEKRNNGTTTLVDATHSKTLRERAPALSALHLDPPAGAQRQLWSCLQKHLEQSEGGRPAVWHRSESTGDGAERRRRPSRQRAESSPVRLSWAHRQSGKEPLAGPLCTIKHISLSRSITQPWLIRCNLSMKCVSKWIYGSKSVVSSL